ncbi:hypothetical protein [Herbaspirillum rubrisubalbicans]|uniref:Uncharacterized protein n=1 Tax=Herbaspirillum rubrisubalbicans TaxID=80842 RepID=A0AAD0UB55_9BURK|nr:hypothetical protein [Herbaspirillum rubrisubalbicans]AYR26642.1 hypothetical protein RC54_23705 [Herbaspirillum rubrisubalbicans]
MDWFDILMPYAIYAALALCMVGLLASIVLFIALERRWQVRDMEALEALAVHWVAPPRCDDLPIHPWEELRNRIGEMQIVADEIDRPAPYKNIA